MLGPVGWAVLWAGGWKPLAVSMSQLLGITVYQVNRIIRLN